MTDAERLEKWYAEQNFLPGVKSILRMFMVITMYKTMKNQFSTEYRQYIRLKETTSYLSPGKKKNMSYGCMQVHPSQLNRKMYQNF